MGAIDFLNTIWQTHQQDLANKWFKFAFYVTHKSVYISLETILGKPKEGKNNW